MALLDKVSIGKATRPLAFAFVIAVVWFAAQEHYNILFAAVGVVAASYVLDLIMVRCALLPLSMRLTPCLLMISNMATLRLTPSWQGEVVLILFLLHLLLLFREYQDCMSAGYVFFAFLMLGIASLLFVHIFFFLPLLWLMMAVALQMLTPRTFCASLYGIALPYFFWAITLLYTHDTTPFVAHFAALGLFAPLNSSAFSPFLLGTLAVLIVVATVSSSFFLRHRHNESIRSRMLYYTIMVLGVFALLFLLLQPQHADPLLWLVLSSLSAVAAHYFSVARGRLATSLFLFFLVAILVGTAVSIYFY